MALKSKSRRRAPQRTHNHRYIGPHANVLAQAQGESESSSNTPPGQAQAAASIHNHAAMKHEADRLSVHSAHCRHRRAHSTLYFASTCAHDICVPFFASLYIVCNASCPTLITPSTVACGSQSAQQEQPQEPRPAIRGPQSVLSPRVGGLKRARGQRRGDGDR